MRVWVRVRVGVRVRVRVRVWVRVRVRVRVRVGVRVGVGVRARVRDGGHLVEGLAQLALDDLALLVAAVDLAQDDLVVVGDAHDGRGQVAVGAEVAHVGLDRRLPGLLARDFRAREQAESERRLAVVGDAWSG